MRECSGYLYVYISIIISFSSLYLLNIYDKNTDFTVHHYDFSLFTQKSCVRIRNNQNVSKWQECKMLQILLK